MQADSRRTVVAHNVIRRQVVKPFCRCAIFYAASNFSCIRPNDLMGKQHERTYFARTMKLRFHMHGKRKLYALCVMRYMATMEKHVNGCICPDTTCGWSCGCEWLRMRRTESLHVAIHAEKSTKSEVGSWGIREYDVRVGCFLSFRQLYQKAKYRREKQNSSLS